MNKHANPLDYLLQCCEETLQTGQWKLDKFLINNAKDELAKLRKLNKCLDTHQFSVGETHRWLACEKDRCELDEKYKTLLNFFQYPVAWGKVNDKGDLYDLRTQPNPFTPESALVPLYSNKVEFKDFYAKHRK